MIKITRIAIIALSLGFVFCFVSLGYAKGKTSQQVEKLLKEEKNELNLLKRKLKKQEKKLSSLGKKESSVLQTLESLRNRKKIRERELKIYKWNIKINQDRIQSLQKRLADQEMQLRWFRGVVKQRLRRIYKDGDMFLVKVLFSADNFPNLLQRLKYMEKVIDYDGTIFEEYVNRLTDLEIEKDKLLNIKETLLDLEKGVLVKKASLKEESIKKSSYLKKIKNQKSLAMQARIEMLRASKSLNQLIGKLKEKLVLKEGPDFKDMRGRLGFPVKGKLTRGFGKKWDRKFGAYIVHNGINLKAIKGTRVTAVFFGKVLFTGFLEGYGNLVIIGHGKQYHTLYGNLDKILVKQGDVVEEGRVIGQSGDSGSLVGETLYFELRHKGKPIKPNPWFQVAKKR